MVVGAPYTDVTGVFNCGAASVYHATTGALVATLHNPVPAAGDEFGGSVAISGNCIVVGADRDDTTAFGAGSAYVFDLGCPTPCVKGERDPHANESGFACPSGSVFLVRNEPQAPDLCAFAPLREISPTALAIVADAGPRRLLRREAPALRSPAWGMACSAMSLPPPIVPARELAS